MNSQSFIRSIKIYFSLIFMAVFLFAQSAQALTYDEIVRGQTGGRVLGASTPTFSNIQVTNITTTTALVTWTTNVAATSQVIINDVYPAGQTITPLYQPTSRQPEPHDNNFVTNHSVTLTNLRPSTTYVIDVASQDASGNIGVSGAFDSGGYEIPGTFLTVSTPNINTAGSLDFRMDTIGGKNVFAGSDLYFGFTMVLLSGNFPSGSPWTPIVSVSGLPSSVTTHVICAANNDPTNENADNWGGQCGYGGNTGSIRLRTSVSAPTGSYTAVFTYNVGGISKTFNYAFNILPTPSAVVKQNVSSIPPIPGLAKWQSTMTTLGPTWCNWANTNQMGFGVTQQIWYYDGGRVFLQLGDYTHDPQYLTCANSILSQYAAYSAGGYRAFPFGLMMHYLRYGDAASKQAVATMLSNVAQYGLNSASPSWGSLTDPYAMRELAYAVDTMVAAQELGLPNTPSPFLPMAVDGLISMMDQLDGSNPYQFNQMFMQGLVSESLIEYYNVSHDARIPPIVKKMLDWIWNNAVNQQTGAISYAYLYQPPEYDTSLNNLIVPAYAWYWNITGDPTYQQEGDFLFSHSLDEDISYG